MTTFLRKQFVAGDSCFVLLDVQHNFKWIKVRFFTSGCFFVRAYHFLFIFNIFNSILYKMAFKKEIFTFQFVLLSLYA